MKDQNSRTHTRTPVAQVETVHVYHDSWMLPYPVMFKMLDDLPNTYAVYSVVALLSNISESGLGIEFVGQQIMANILLKPGEPYVLKLTLIMPVIEPDLAPFVKSGDNYQYILLKGTCRWFKQSEGQSKAGFELSEGNEPVVLKFVKDHFKVKAKT